MLFVPLVPAMTISREIFDINVFVKYERLFEKFISGNSIEVIHTLNYPHLFQRMQTDLVV